MYVGDLKNEDSVLEWLSDDDNRELADEIEAVNSRMLERLLDESPFLAVYFCKYILHTSSNKFQPDPGQRFPHFSYSHATVSPINICPAIRNCISLRDVMSSIIFHDPIMFIDDNDCAECAAVLTELENIDDEADKFGIINNSLSSDIFLV